MSAVLLITAGTQVVPSLDLPTVTPVSPAAVLPGAPFDARIEANLDRVRSALSDAAAEPARTYQRILDQGRQLLHFDPDANLGRGSWAELVGEFGEHTETVGILVPGSTAYILDHNFDKYYQRASHLVEESNGRLALVVWADGTYPKGWLRGAMSRYHEPLGEALARFSHDLRREISDQLGPGHGVSLLVAGHSFGGAVVGAAERYGLEADAVLHIASAGVGHVRDPYDYPDPTRPRYSMTAPGDLISFVQGLPTPPGLGHGPSPDSFRCVVTLPTGRLPSNPDYLDESGDALGDRAGERIGGVSSHSEVFIHRSDAWRQIYRFFIGSAPPPPRCPEPGESAPVKARVLPLAVPRVVTAYQCRAGGGLRPAGRHRWVGA
ncbi:hypothetical protein JQS43_18010 [Natronosporangium hydrolyticum]|uniref:Alpha/beta hydrolase n=1 Tax=Natronosporangium hydrolyticum TaxID=2811111 RepID=A0A895YH33_9ACTN|nr:hypothetical protein [Natronosporangium hydrolyticum]QSB13480.1 hypothetical protein JQS43_18010 [Natronosporangium hydrolyticum]